MRILIVGDLHLRAKKLKDVENAWVSAIGWAHKNSVDLIVQAGDVFDHANVYGREASTGTIYNAFLAPFVAEPKPLPLFVIPGNHDLGSPKDKDALAPVDKYPWITVVRKPAICEINDKFSICAVPWLNRVHLIARMLQKGCSLDDATQRVNSIIAKLMTPLGAEVQKQHDKDRFVLFVGHLEITGARMPTGLFHGGTFEFAPANLKTVGADAYALAHIHLRQYIDGLPNANDGYLGCLCQLNFGEQGNDVGCRLLEVEGRKIVTDRWLENRSSPKYFTGLSMAGIPYRPGTDYVKLRGVQKPEDLPEGVMFERLPQAIQSRTRVEDKLDCDLSLRTLISAWRSVVNCPIDIEALLAEAEKLKTQCQIESEAIGSLERVERIKLKNLTCHGSTQIDLGVKGIIGIAGPNGTGKTTAIESIMLALYGISPSRPALQSLMPKGETVDSAVELEFISGGKKYISRREFAKSKKTFGHKAYLIEEGNSQPIASGVDGVQKACTTLVGDPDLVLAGIFSSQGDSGNLVKLKPAQRKDLFAKLLGTEKFICIAKAADKIFQTDMASISAEKNRIETLSEELSFEEKDAKRLEELEVDLSKKQADLQKAQESLEKTVETLTAMESVVNDRKRQIAEIEELGRKRQKIKADGIALKQKRKEFEALDGSSLDAELEAARKARDEAQQVTDQINEINQKAIDAQKARAALKESRQNERQIMVEKLNVGRNKADVLKTRLENDKHRASLIVGFPDLKECQTCPLAKDSIKARDSVASMEQELVALEEKISKGMKIVAEHQRTTDKMLEDHEIPTVPAELVDKRRQLMGEAMKLQALEKQHEKILSAKAEIAKIDVMIENARQDYAEIEAKIKSYGMLPTINEHAHTEKLAEKSEHQTRIRQINTEISNFNMEIGKYEAKIEQHASRKKELEDLLADVAAKEQRSAIYEALAKAFSRDGIPQLIVDSAVPHLQEIMFDMMSEIDGKWTIRIATQKETGKGTIQERIELLVDDGDDERDIATYSGGEMNLLSTIVRIAFSILQAERSGKGLKILVLDEAMYFADNEYSDAFMRMLKKLPKYFNQIFVISHSEYVLSSIPDKIFFARSSNGKTSVKTDFATI